ncbi:MAG: prepilin-type N-terminal cleavage/methylation domain-containing protein [Planctomycetota bacterium]|nr:prepilin-type N-terminal cleavage/methylation domain-containing protein [Planctomycetota bacterium]
MKRAPRGFALLEVMVCVSIMAVIMGSIAAALGAMHRALHVSARREVLASSCSKLSTSLCDDLRRSTQATWRPRSPAGGAQALISMDQPGGVQVLYAFVPGRVERQVFRGGQKAEHRPFDLDVLSADAAVAPGNSGSAEAYWPSGTAEAGRLLRAEGGSVPFVQVTLRVNALDGTSKTLVTGAALRVEAGP